MSTDTEYRDAIVAAHPYVPGPHDSGDSEFFQESVFLCWADHATGFGGLQRIGQEVNRGLSNQWTAAYGPDGTRFRDLDPKLELRDEWRTEEYFKGGDKTTLVIDAGVAEVLPDRITVLIGMAEKPEVIDVAKESAVKADAERDMKQATTLEEAERARVALVTAQMRQRAAGRKG